MAELGLMEGMMRALRILLSVLDWARSIASTAAVLGGVPWLLVEAYPSHPMLTKAIAVGVAWWVASAVMDRMAARADKWMSERLIKAMEERIAAGESLTDTYRKEYDTLAKAVREHDGVMIGMTLARRDRVGQA